MPRAFVEHVNFPAAALLAREVIRDLDKASNHKCHDKLTSTTTKHYCCQHGMRRTSGRDDGSSHSPLPGRAGPPARRPASKNGVTLEPLSGAVRTSTTEGVPRAGPPTSLALKKHLPQGKGWTDVPSRPLCCRPQTVSCKARPSKMTCSCSRASAPLWAGAQPSAMGPETLKRKPTFDPPQAAGAAPPRWTESIGDNDGSWGTGEAEPERADANTKVALSLLLASRPQLLPCSAVLTPPHRVVAPRCTSAGTKQILVLLPKRPAASRTCLLLCEAPAGSLPLHLCGALTALTPGCGCPPPPGSRSWPALGTQDGVLAATPTLPCGPSPGPTQYPLPQLGARQGALATMAPHRAPASMAPRTTAKALHYVTLPAPLTAGLPTPDVTLALGVWGRWDSTPRVWIPTRRVEEPLLHSPGPKCVRVGTLGGQGLPWPLVSPTPGQSAWRCVLNERTTRTVSCFAERAVSVERPSAGVALTGPGLDAEDPRPRGTWALPSRSREPGHKGWCQGSIQPGAGSQQRGRLLQAPPPGSRVKAGQFGGRAQQSPGLGVRGVSPAPGHRHWSRTGLGSVASWEPPAPACVEDGWRQSGQGGGGIQARAELERGDEQRGLSERTRVTSDWPSWAGVREQAASRTARGCGLGRGCPPSRCVERGGTFSVCTDDLSFHFDAATKTTSHSPAASQDAALEARSRGLLCGVCRVGSAGANLRWSRMSSDFWHDGRTHSLCRQVVTESGVLDGLCWELQSPAASVCPLPAGHPQKLIWAPLRAQGEPGRQRARAPSGCTRMASWPRPGPLGASQALLGLPAAGVPDRVALTWGVRNQGAKGCEDRPNGPHAWALPGAPAGARAAAPSPAVNTPVVKVGEPSSQGVLFSSREPVSSGPGRSRVGTDGGEWRLSVLGASGLRVALKLWLPARGQVAGPLLARKEPSPSQRLVELACVLRPAESHVAPPAGLREGPTAFLWGRQTEAPVQPHVALLTHPSGALPVRPPRPHVIKRPKSNIAVEGRRTSVSSPEHLVKPLRHYAVFLSEDSSDEECRQQEGPGSGFTESFFFSAPFEWPQPYRTLKESDSAEGEAESPEQRAREPAGPAPAPPDRAASVDLLEDVFSALDVDVPPQPLGQAKSLEDLRTPRDPREQPGTFDYQRLDLGRGERSRGMPAALKLAHPYNKLWSLGQDDMAIPSKHPDASPEKPSAQLGSRLPLPHRPQAGDSALDPGGKDAAPVPTPGTTIPRPQGRKTPELGIVPPPPTARPPKLQAAGALGDVPEQERRALSPAPFPGLLPTAAQQGPPELLQPLSLAAGAAGSGADALLALLDPLSTSWSGGTLPPGPPAPNAATPFTPQFSFPPVGTPSPFPQPSLNPFVPPVPAALPAMSLVSTPARPFGASPASLGPTFAPGLLLSGSGFCAPHRSQPNLSALSMPNLFGQVPVGAYTSPLQPLGPPAVAPSRIRTLPLARSSARAAEAKQGRALRPGDPTLLPSRLPQGLEPALQPSAPREARDPFEDLLRKTKQDMSPAPAPAPGSVEQLRKQWETFE
ncbi:DENN domain-containing protein 1A [Galemys pyrenaicus]|uniref:DENN domain-containing protein 1A n=1 Tax=Galemys pyrenaicus TaxID=202257 RepID=A0A8J6DLG8_GALPY|nr:DENN domain-containing protein 1A [Galemys pyrenaicus]